MHIHIQVEVREFMEPEVHIVERHFQEVKHFCTMTDTRCKGGKREEEPIPEHHESWETN